jgi:hypothetical protein
MVVREEHAKLMMTTVSLIPLICLTATDRSSLGHCPPGVAEPTYKPGEGPAPTKTGGAASPGATCTAHDDHCKSLDNFLLFTHLTISKGTVLLVSRNQIMLLVEAMTPQSKVVKQRLVQLAQPTMTIVSYLSSHSAYLQQNHSNDW